MKKKMKVSIMKISSSDLEKQQVLQASIWWHIPQAWIVMAICSAGTLWDRTTSFSCLLMVPRHNIIQHF